MIGVKPTATIITRLNSAIIELVHRQC